MKIILAQVAKEYKCLPRGGERATKKNTLRIKEWEPVPVLG